MAAKEDEWDLLADLENTGSIPETPPKPKEEPVNIAGSLWNDEDLPPLPEDIEGGGWPEEGDADPGDWQAPADWAPPPLDDTPPEADAPPPNEAPPRPDATPSEAQRPQKAGAKTAKAKSTSVPKVMLLAIPALGLLAIMIALVALLGPSPEERMASEAEDLLEAGDIQGAARLMEQVLSKEEDPLKELDERRRLRGIYTDADMLKEATSQAFTIAQKDLATADDLLALTRLYEIQGRYGEVARLYPRLGAHPEATPSLRLDIAGRLAALGDWEESQRLISGLKKSDIARSAETLDIELLADRGLLSEADTKLRDALDRYPHHPDLLAAQALISLERGDFAAADEALLAALKEDSNHRDALGRRLEVLRHRREVDAGAKTVASLLDHHSSDPLAHYYAARYFGAHPHPTRAQGERAAAHCKELSTLDPASDLKPLCDTIAAMAIANLGAAEGPAARALKASPGRQDAWLGSIGLALAQGDRSTAFLTLSEALDRLPDPPALRIYKGNLLAYQGELAEAWKIYKELLQEIPDYIPALMGQGQIEHSQRDFSRADRLYKQVLELDPFQVDAHYGRADIYLARGRGDMAIQEYKAIAALSPEEYEALVRIAAVYAVDGDEALSLVFIEEALKAGAPLTAITENEAFSILQSREALQRILLPYR